MLKRLIIILYIGLYFLPKIDAQTLHWANVFTSKRTDRITIQSVSDMKADMAGNMVAAGYNDASCTLNNNPLAAKGSAYLAKFDTAGSLKWLISGNDPSVNLTHIEIGPKGDYFFSGFAGKNIQPFPSPKPPKQNSGGFIGKCGPAGNIIWIRKYIDYHLLPGYSLEGINDFKVDDDENIYFTGDLPVYPGYILIDTAKFAAKQNGAFIVKFDSTGQLKWLTLGSNAYPFLSIDSKQNTYYWTQYDPAHPSASATAIIKYNAGGKLIKKLVFDSTNQNVLFTGLANDTLNNLYIIGQMLGDFTLNGKTYTYKSTSLNECFMFKFDSNLNVQWALFSETGFGNVNVNNKTGFIYITGDYIKPFILGSQPSVNAPSDTVGNDNWYFAKIKQDGTVLWVRNTTYSNDMHYSPILVEDACDNFYTAFSFYDELHFNGLNLSYPQDIFLNSVIAKFSSDSLGFKFQSNSCAGLSLKNISKPAFKKFEWFASKYPGDTTIGKLIATTRDLNYQFPHKGRYIITMQGIKAAGCTNLTRDTFYVAGSPVAGFMEADSQGCQYVNYNFSDTSHADSINAAIGESWYWDFGDQSTPLTYTKTKRNMVSHVYTQSGTYTVKLVYSNGICTDTFVSAQKVKIIPAPRPGFGIAADAGAGLGSRVVNSWRVGNSTRDTLTGCIPLDIKLTDKSDGTAKRWLYTIRPAFAKAMAGKAGDKDSATVPSFGYIFKTAGLYVIHQYLTGITGCVTEDSVYVKANAGVSPNDKPVILRATFNSKNTIDLHWLPMPGAKKYSIFRNSGTNSSLNPIAIGDWLADVVDTSYNDLAPNPSPGGEGPGVRYTIQATDSCANRSAFSNIARPIILTGKCIDNQYFLLNWSPYEKWQNGVYTYQIEMKDPVTGNFGPLHNNPSNDTLFKDGDHFTNTSLVNCYRIKATEQVGYNQVSYSNINCVPYLPAIFVPNIFSPDGNGLNDSFKIVTIGIKNYSLTVYNRWGEVVYTKEHGIVGQGIPAQGRDDGGGVGWDGMFHGQPVPEGIYLYTITAHGLYQNFYQKGTVELVR